MITASAFIELPGAYSDTDSALNAIETTYGFQQDQWYAQGEVLAVTSTGAHIDLDEGLSEFFGKDTQVVVYHLEGVDENLRRAVSYVQQ